MRIEMEFQGIDELVKALEQCATEKEIQGLNKSIVTKAQPIIQKRCRARCRNQEIKTCRGEGSARNLTRPVMQRMQFHSKR